METEKKIPVGNTSQSGQSSEHKERIAVSPLPFTGRKPATFSFQGNPMPQQNETTSRKEGSMTRFLDGVISVSLTALFFGLPVFFTGSTLQGIAFEKQIYFYFWLLLAVVSWVSKGVITGEMRIRKTPLDVPLAIFLIAYALSAFFSIDRWHSFWGAFGDPSRGFLNVVSLVAAYYLVLSHFNKKRLYLMLGALLSATLVLMIWSLLAISGVHFLPASLEQHAPLSLLGSLTALMIFLGSMLPLLIAAIATLRSVLAKNPIFKNVVTILIGLCILADLALIFLLFPYVTWLSLVIAFAFFLLYMLAKVVKIDDRLAWIPMVVFVVILAFYMIGSTKLIQTNLPVEATPNVKLSWEVLRASFNDRMFLGSGPATYGYNFSLYRPQEYNLQPLSNLRFGQGTGLYFEALPTMGLIGFVVFAILTLSFLGVGLFLLAQRRENDKLLSLGLWSASIGFLVAAFLTQFNGSILTIGVLIASLTLAVLMKESQSEESYRNLSLQSSPKFALALAFVFLVVSAGVAFMFAFIGKAYWADHLAMQAMESSVGSDDGVAKMSKALQYMPRESRYAGYLGQIYLTVASQELGKNEKIRNADILKNSVQSANSFVGMAHALSPNDIVIQEIMAQTYENTLFIAGLRQDVLDSVQRAYEGASTLEPHNPVYYMKLGQVKKTLANSASGSDQKALLTDAENLFRKSIEEKPDFVPGYLNLGLTQESSNDLDGAIKSLATGVSIDRTSKDIDELKYNLARMLRVRGGKEDLALAEVLLKEVLAANDKSLNAHMAIGLVYEQTDRKDDAIKSYQQALSLINGDGTDTPKKQIQAFIDNVKMGKSNVPGADEPKTITPSESPDLPEAPAVTDTPAEVPDAAPENTQQP